jgi:FMN phosphatase YigB (HAD superfamily)
LRESQTLPDVVSFMRGLHGHFLKLGIVANLGTMEVDFLNRFNAAQALFEVIASPLSLGTSQPLLSREVFTEACKLIREYPDACLAVSGHDDYLAFAAKMGMQTIPFTTMRDLYGKLIERLAKDTPSAVAPYQPQPGA